MAYRIYILLFCLFNRFNSSGLFGLVLRGRQAYAALVGIGLSGLFGQLAMTRAFGLGSALLSAVLQYSTIIFAAGLGMLLWSDIPDAIAWGGMVLIIVSGLLSAWRTYMEDRIMKGQNTTR